MQGGLEANPTLLVSSLLVWIFHTYAYTLQVHIITFSEKLYHGVRGQAIGGDTAKEKALRKKRDDQIRSIQALFQFPLKEVSIS